MTDVLLPGGTGDDGGDGARTGIEPIEINVEMERSFLEYAMSVIVQRALPDARDGLKPVHRRILYAMHIQNYRPDRPHVKCAKVVGETMAKFHPHGDMAIYDALVRMAQPFSLRDPLIDFHGNYGSPDFSGGRRTLHRVPALAVGHAHAREHRRGNRRHGPQLPERRRRADRAAFPVPEPAGEREPGDRRRYGDQHPSPQPG